MEYRPLDASRNEIRLLVLSKTPAASHLPVHSRLEHFSLDDTAHGRADVELSQQNPASESSINPNKVSFPPGDYVALSYVWGPLEPAKQRRVFVNGHVTKVTNNLEEALHGLQRLPEIKTSGPGLKVWVDALCINQNDLKERSQQVKRMRDIYARAGNVIVWLGKMGKDNRVLQLLRTLSQLYTTLEDPTLIQSPWRRGPNYFDQDSLRALFAFLSCTYWQRLWIIQELAMGSDSSIVVCGDELISWGEVHNAARFIIGAWTSLRQEVDKALEGEEATELFRLLWLVCHLHEMGSKNKDKEAVLKRLGQALRLSQNASATDMKDKAYGLLGLLDPAISSRITPDYMRPIQEVYIDFAKAVIQAHENLDIILVGPRNDLPTGWPSWVPDWRRGFGQSDVGFSALCQTGGDYAMDVTFSDNGDLLFCHGFRLPIDARRVGGQVDRVDDTSHILRSPRSGRQLGGEDELVNRFMKAMSLRSNTSRDDIQHPSSSLFSNQPLQEPSQSLPDDQLDWFLQGGPEAAVRLLETSKKNDQFFESMGAVKRMIHKSSQGLEELSTVLETRRGAPIAFTRGYFVYSSYGLEDEDIICVLLGCGYPVILRPCGDNWRLVGECFIYEIMGGEAIQWLGEKDCPLEQFGLC
jgi:Heterokaryon incompatibility protein (HET)